MSEQKQKIEVGKGKKRNANWLTATINPDKIQDHIQEYNGNRYVKLNINISDTPDQYGKDVKITIDTYKPEPKNETQWP